MKLKRDELQKHINALPYTELKDMVLSYAHNHNIYVQEDIETLAFACINMKK